MTKQPDYSDFTRDMTIHPDTGDLVLLVDEQSVKNRIKNLMLTSPYERYGNPKFGAGLDRYLFENVSENIADLIKETIKHNIEVYEPQVIIDNIDVKANLDRNEYGVELIFHLKTNPNPIVINQILKRAR